MKHYTFNVVETRESTFEIEAENIHEAGMLARDAYYGFMDDEDNSVGDELEVTLKVYGCETEKESDWV